jgi:Sap, sulfolipid-1-addressing protein
VGSVLIQLVPLILGCMFMPTWIMLVVSLLASEHGRVGASAFVSGIIATRLTQGLIFGTLSSVYITHQTSRVETIVISALLLITGLVMWATAVRQIFARGESGALIGKWMSLLTVLTPTRAFALGVGLVITSGRSWLFLLSAIGLIGQADLSTAQGVIVFLIYVFGAASLIIAPILIAVWAPEKFDTLAVWLRTYDRQITIVVSIILGGFFIWYGVSHLLPVIG